VTSQGYLRFVLLEDDDLDAELVQEQVRRAGFDVAWQRARGEEELVTALSAAPVSLILSDFSLPGYDGLAALELAQQRAAGVPFLFVSGAIGEERATETLRRGATDYVLKDRLERLPGAIERALELSRERRRREVAEAERDRLLQSERRAREAAELANRMKDEFLATASHELRTPLNAILGWAKLLRSGQPSAEMLSRGLATIERNAVSQSRLIEDILDISRIVTGKVHLRVARVPVATFLSAAVEALRPAATAKHISLTVEHGDLGEIDGDAERLQQVLWNLVSNAVKFTPAHGKVTVTAERDPDWLRLSVSDTGNGIEPKTLARVFERFWQADPSATRRQGGLGLGLSIVRYLVELHGGRVHAESEGPGKGSRFMVELPLLLDSREVASVRPEPPPSEAPPSSVAPTLNALQGLTAVVVDDDPDAREVVTLILRGQGASVTPAAGAAEALDAVQRLQPRVLVSDIGMPEVDGYALIRSVRALPRERGGGTPAIALSAYTRDMDRHQALDAGFQTHLAKPVVPADLVRAILQVCGVDEAPPEALTPR